MLDVIGVSLCILGAVFNARKSMWCWPIWMLGNDAWLAYWYPREEYSSVILFLIFTGLNLYGYFSWRRDYKVTVRVPYDSVVRNLE